MAALSLSDIFQFAHVLKTRITDKTKKVVAQIGSVNGEGQVDSDNVEWWQHVGFVSRPPKAEKGKEAAQAVVIRQGNYDAAIASQDLRGIELAGQLKDGETCLYAPGADGEAQARMLLKADGSINLFTKAGNESGGTGMGIFINPSGAVSILNPGGAAILVGDDGSIKLFNGSGGIQIKENGAIKISSGGALELSGGSITLGGFAALPLAIGPQVVTALSAIQVQLTALATAITGISAIPPLVALGAPALAATATAAVTAGSVAVSAASALIPTKRVQGD